MEFSSFTINRVKRCGRVKNVTNAQQQREAKCRRCEVQNSLIKLYREGHIPFKDCDFYGNLHHESLIKDCLTEPQYTNIYSRFT